MRMAFAWCRPDRGRLQVSCSVLSAIKNMDKGMDKIMKDKHRNVMCGLRRMGRER
jgi:hypothetical protein